MMSMYLMMLYVTVEQEVALKSYFGEQGWFFKKPDMSVLTENLGGFVQTTMKKDITWPVESDQHPIERILNPTTGAVEYPEMSSVKRKAQEESISTLQAAKQIKVTNSSSTMTFEDNSLHDVTESFVDGLVPKLEQELEEICNKNDSVMDNTVDKASDINNGFRTDVGLIQTINKEGKRVTVKEEPDISEDNDNVDDNDIQVEVMQGASGDTNDEFGRAKEKHTSNRKKKEGRPKAPSEAFCVCRFCGKQFRNKSTFRQHEARHAGTTPYKCEICGKQNVSKTAHTLHMQRVHIKEKKHVCDKCGKGFTTEVGLKLHKDRENKVYKYKIYKCDLCKFATEKKSDLDDHSSKHTGVGHHMCRMCAKTYHFRASLRVHMTRAHKLDKNKT
ncbi:zinc finger protein 484-like isoform X2 [Mya arenaria]|uniref:zinc finger protein 484-like isoform X2 n=1 Tax=Mya arenaria TaxID=6604 RepID=UPI0022E276BF|nr:zinc finger protein 484-like isoform X2 [Mya arenaria]